MKLYCKNCAAELRLGNSGKASQRFLKSQYGLCPCCEEIAHVIIPDYEAPEQHEKRTGKPIHDNTAVWYKDRLIDSSWELEKYGMVKPRWQNGEYGKLRNPGADFIVIADPPIAPPNDWRPE